MIQYVFLRNTVFTFIQQQISRPFNINFVIGLQ